MPNPAQSAVDFVHLYCKTVLQLSKPVYHSNKEYLLFIVLSTALRCQLLHYQRFLLYICTVKPVLHFINCYVPLMNIFSQMPITALSAVYSVHLYCKTGFAFYKPVYHSDKEDL